MQPSIQALYVILKDMFKIGKELIRKIVAWVIPARNICTESSL